MSPEWRDPGQREWERDEAVRRREAALKHIVTTRWAIVGASVVASCGFAVLVEVVAPGHSAAASTTAANTAGRASGAVSSNASQPAPGPGSQGTSQGLFPGPAPSAASGPSSATSGGS